MDNAKYPAEITNGIIPSEKSTIITINVIIEAIEDLGFEVIKED